LGGKLIQVCPACSQGRCAAATAATAASAATAGRGTEVPADVNW
jgi:hypothetical protein